MRDYYILVGESAKISSASGTHLEYGTNTTELFDGCIRARKVATAELNVTKLDGTYEWFSDTSNIGVWTEVADGDGNLTNNPTITAIFANPIDFNCFKLFFGDTKPIQYNIFFYDTNGKSVFGSVNWIDDYGYLADYTNKNVKTVVISDIKMPPYQRFKLCEIFVGWDMEVFTSANIASCNISASYSPIANEIPTDSMECTLVSDDMRFHPLNEISTKKLKHKVPLRPFTIDNYQAEQLGTYYISDFDCGTGYEAIITAESDMSNIAEKTCNPDLMYNFKNLWYKVSNKKISGSVYRNHMLWEILKIIGITNYTNDSSDLSINTTMENFAQSDNCRELFQSILLGLGSTSYMKRDGKRQLVSTGSALLGTLSHTLDHTIGDMSYSHSDKVNSVKINNLGLETKFCTRQLYSSNNDDFDLEYKAESGNVTYETSFDEKFIPCAISVSTLDDDIYSGRNVMTHHFKGVSPSLYNNLTDSGDTSSNNEFFLMEEDISPGKMKLVVRQLSMLNPDTTHITIYGLMRYKIEDMFEFVMKLTDGDNQIDINIPDFKANFNRIERAWKSFAEYTDEVKFETESPLWIGEKATLPIAYENYSQEKSLKRITASITDVSIDLCSGITKAKGVVKP